MEFQRTLLPGVDLSEQDLDDLLSPLYPKLWGSIREPFDELHRRRSGEDIWYRVYSSGECAQLLRPQIASCAKRLFADDDDIQIKEYRNQMYISYRDQVAITPKKLRPRFFCKPGLTFSSYPTNQNKLWWQQRNDGGLPDLIRVIVGYQFVNEMTDIKIYVAYPRGKFLKLCYLMPEQDATGLRITEVPIEQEDHEKDYEIVPTKESRKRGS